MLIFLPIMLFSTSEVSPTIPNMCTLNTLPIIIHMLVVKCWHQMNYEYKLTIASSYDTEVVNYRV